jgi:putative heme iron utilization protein
MDKTFDAKFMNYAVNHINEDHKDALLDIFKAFHKTIVITDVTLLSYDKNEMHVEANADSDQPERFSIPFPRPLETAQDFRPVLIAMLNDVRG